MGRSKKSNEIAEVQLFIGKSTLARNKRKKKISLDEFLKGIKTGTWKAQVEKVRDCERGSKEYDSAKLKVDAVWIMEHDFMVFDFDHGKLQIPKKYILARFRSVGGFGEAIIVRTPSENRKEYRIALQNKYGFKDGQVNDDRCRYVSYDPKIQINWQAEIDMDVNTNEEVEDDQHSLAPEYFRKAKAQDEPLDNTTALAVYSWFRHRSIGHKKTIDEMEQCLWKTTGTMSTARKREKYYNKWVQQYDYPVAIKQLNAVITEEADVKVEVDPEEDVDWYCTEDEQIDVMLQTAISSFVPLHFRWRGKKVSVCNSTVLSGPPSSGKGTIHDMVGPLLKQANEIAFELGTWVKEEIQIKGMDSDTSNADEKKAKRLVPNIGTVLGFDSSDAAVFGSLSEVRTMLLYGNEIGALVGSSNADHNKTRIASILSFMEGESTQKMLKKNDLYGKTSFYIDEPLFSLLSGGTPESVAGYFSKHIDDGMVSRLLFLVLRPTDIFNQKTYKKVDPTEYVSGQDVLDYVMGGYKTAEVKYDQQHIERKLRILHDIFEGTPAYGGIIRGVRNCVKRAAVQLWIDGVRSGFSIPNSYIDWQIGVLIKSMEYVNSFGEYATDRFGRSTLNETLSTRLNGKGKFVPVSDYVSIDKSNIKLIKKLHSEGMSIAEIARKAKTGRKFIYKLLKS